MSKFCSFSVVFSGDQIFTGWKLGHGMTQRNQWKCKAPLGRAGIPYPQFDFLAQISCISSIFPWFVSRVSISRWFFIQIFRFRTTLIKASLYIYYICLVDHSNSNIYVAIGGWFKNEYEREKNQTKKAMLEQLEGNRSYVVSDIKHERLIWHWSRLRCCSKSIVNNS